MAMIKSTPNSFC